MNLEASVMALLAQNLQLVQENDQLKLRVGLLKENVELKARLSRDTLGDFTVCSASRMTQSNLWQHTFDERQLQRELQQSKSRSERRKWSPLQSSAHSDTDEAAELQSCRTDTPLCGAAQPRLLGEIAYQLEKRILSHVFQAHRGFYGFTVLNIPEKIVEVSTHPMTGKVDEGSQLLLSQRYTELMDTLGQRGYKAALHPPFCEFIVNSYGILRPSNGTDETKYNDRDFLRMMIGTTAPKKLQKDLYLVLDCLCYMAGQDRRSLLFWSLHPKLSRPGQNHPSYEDQLK